MSRVRKSCFRIISTVLFVCMSHLLHSSYPIEPPHTEGYLRVSEKHQIFYATYGNPKGVPIVVLHGGPGLGCNDALTRFFDLTRWHVVMFDQRGAMRSTPFASMDENTTQHSIEDIERLRKHLNIKQWAIFGWSWGSCLALAYGQSYPDTCLGFVLQGIFLGRDQDIRFFKDMTLSKKAYDEFLPVIPKEERHDLPTACYSRIMNPNPDTHMGIAKALMRYQFASAPSPTDPEVVESVLKNEQFVLSFMRAFLHYAYHGCFLKPDQILSNIQRVDHLPAVIVHGTADTVCFPEQAHLLHSRWKKSTLWMIDGAGHSQKEPSIADAIVAATNLLRSQLAQNNER